MKTRAELLAENKSNIKLHDRLEANKAHVLKVIKEVSAPKPVHPVALVDDDRLTMPIEQIDRETLYIAISLGKIDPTTAILKLNQLRDQEAGIIWHESVGPDGVKVRVRDARNQLSAAERGKQFGPDKLFDDTHSETIKFLNDIRGAYDLLEGHRGVVIEEQKKNYKILIASFVDAMDKKEDRTPTEILNEYRGLLALQVALDLEIDSKEACKKLDVAMSFAGMQDEHSHVVTLCTDGKDPPQTIFQADVAMLGLTKELHEEYKKITNFADPEKPKWFANLKPWEQKLVIKYVDSLTDGNHAIATQLRRQVVGLRNAFNSVNGIIEGGEAVVLQDSFHSGALPMTPAKEDAAEILRVTKMNMAQMHAFNADPVDDRPIGFNVLNNSNPLANGLNGFASLFHLTAIKPAHSESFIVEHTSKAAAALGDSFAKLPINDKRSKYGGEDPIDKSSDIVIGKITTQLENKLLDPSVAGDQYKNLDVLISYLRNPEDVGYDQALVAIQELSKPIAADLILLKALIDLKQARCSADDSNNRNLVVANSLDVISFAISSDKIAVEILDAASIAALRDEPTISCRYNTSCASGKDRTMFAMFKELGSVLASYYCARSDSVRDLEQLQAMEVAVMKPIALAGHVDYMANTGGGNPGCMGLIKEAKGAAPAYLQNESAILELVCQDTLAKGNKFKHGNVCGKKSDEELGADLDQIIAAHVHVVENPLHLNALADLQAAELIAAVEVAKHAHANIKVKKPLPPTPPQTQTVEREAEMLGAALKEELLHHEVQPKVNNGIIQHNNSTTITAG